MAIDRKFEDYGVVILGEWVFSGFMFIVSVDLRSIID
jgi:hypothetical protein